MNWKKLLDDNSLQKKKFSFKEVESVLNKSCKSIKAAKILLKENIDEPAFEQAYKSMILASRALIFSLGCRPRTVGSHIITIKFCEFYLGKKFKILIEKFKRMKQKRNYLIYGTDLIISEIEAKNAIKTAEDFIKRIEKIIQKKNPQKKLV